MSADEPISPAEPVQPDRTEAAQAEQQRAARDRATKRFNAIAVTLIAFVTLLSAVAAFLQNDAANRQSSAARDVQRYAASQLSAALQSQQAQNFDAAVQRDWLNLAYERSQLLDSGTVTDTTRADQLAELMRLTAGFSPMLQAPYLSDPIAGAIDLPRYYADQEVRANLLAAAPRSRIVDQRCVEHEISRVRHGAHAVCRGAVSLRHCGDHRRQAARRVCDPGRIDRQWRDGVDGQHVPGAGQSPARSSDAGHGARTRRSSIGRRFCAAGGRKRMP